MTTLVTGGCGVMGSWVARRIVAGGEPVVVLDNRDDRSLLGEPGYGLYVVVGDITDLGGFERVLREHEVTAIAHMAAVLDDESETNLYAAYHVNIFGTMTVLEAARRAGVPRVVCLSSKDALGQMYAPYTHPTYEPVPMGLPPKPYGTYGVTKWTTEQLTEHFAELTGMTISQVRLMSTYGPGKGSRHTQTGLVSRVISAAINGDPIEVPVGGDQRTDLIYFGDVAQGVARCLTADLAAGYHLFQIGTGVAHSLNEVVEELERQLPKVDAKVGPGLDYGGRGVGNFYRFDISPAYRQLGFQPEYTLETGIADFIARVRSSAAPSIPPDDHPTAVATV